MARKGSKRKFNLRRVRVTPGVALSTLGTVTAITVDVAGTADGAYRAVSVNGSWNLTGLTGGEGPITVGYAFSDYSVTEIKESLEAIASINLGDKIAQEKANRLVRVVGMLNEAQDELNDGKPLKTRLNWLIPIGKSVNVFAYNEGAQLTTGASVNMTGDMWIKDSS